LLELGAEDREPRLFGIEREPEPAQGGRSECVPRGVWLAPFTGRSDEPLPKLCGARPRSVALPCADQLREPLFAGRLGDTLPPPFTDARPLTPAPAEGGRLLESSRWREDMAALLFASRPARTFADGALLEAPRPPKLPFAGRFIPPLTAPFRPADKPRVSMVRTGMCEAAAAGAVRAITERFMTLAGGVETRPRALAAPVKLARVGEKSARLVTCAPRSEASLTRIDPRLMAWPLTKVFREAAVTARASCA
jgi:hypothetical protein